MHEDSLMHVVNFQELTANSTIKELGKNFQGDNTVIFTRNGQGQIRIFSLS